MGIGAIPWSSSIGNILTPQQQPQNQSLDRCSKTQALPEGSWYRKTAVPANTNSRNTLRPTPRWQARKLAGPAKLYHQPANRNFTIPKP
jgi:hypothetical protein